MTEDRRPLAELLAKAEDGDFLRSVAEPVMQLLMETDVDGMIGGGPHERTTYRNGYRDRTLDTRLGGTAQGSAYAAGGVAVEGACSSSCGRAATFHPSWSPKRAGLGGSHVYDVIAAQPEGAVVMGQADVKEALRLARVCSSAAAPLLASSGQLAGLPSRPRSPSRR